MRDLSIGSYFIHPTRFHFKRQCRRRCLGRWSWCSRIDLGKPFLPTRSAPFLAHVSLTLDPFQFGFDGDDMWKTRRDSLFATLHNNPKAKFVTRAVQFGSEPLFDNVLSPDDLAAQVLAAKDNLSPLEILVTVSDMAYGYQSNGGAQSVLDAIDFVDLHMLPFFSTTATTAADSWPFVQNDLDWINAHANGKKIILSENGWPSMQSGSTRSSSPTAVSDVQQEQDYFDLLDSKCQEFKGNPGGGVAWFAHLYSEDQGAGYGILDNGQLKFPFSPKTSC